MIAALSCWLAVFSGQQAALAYWRPLAAAPVPVLLAADPQLQVSASDYRFLVDAGGFRHEIARRNQIARAAIATSPFDAVAMRQLGMLADLEPSGKASWPYFETAEGMTRRDLPGQVVMINHQIKQGNVAAILAHFDRALRAYPSVSAELFPTLIAASSDPRVRFELARFAGSPWFTSFVGQMIKSDIEPEVLAEFLVQVRPRLSTKAADQLTTALLEKLIGTGRYRDARNWIVRATPNRLAVIDRLGFSVGTTDPSLGSLAWSFSQTGGTEVALTQGGNLQIMIEAGRREVVATRTTILPPGKYAVSQTLSHEADQPVASLAWELRCLPAEASLLVWSAKPAIAAGPQTYQNQFTIPAGCQAQVWKLSSAADSTQGTSSIWLVSLTLSRLP